MPVKKIAKKQPRQEKQKMVDFGTAIKRFWINYGNFNGTAQRSEFWFWVLFNILVTLPFSILGVINPVLEVIFIYPWWAATFVPWLALYSRRFHDAGFSAKWLWIPLMVIFGGAFLLLLLGVAATMVFAFPELVVVVAIPFILAFLAYSVFLFVVLVLPSKLKNNPYRK